MASGALKQRVDAIKEALGFRRYLLAPLILAIVTFVELVLVRLEAAGVSLLIGVPPWVFGLFVMLLAIIYWLIEHIVLLQKRLTPSLAVAYDDKAQDCNKIVHISSDGGKTHHRGRSIRLRVSCDTDANVEHCSGFLTKIEYRALGRDFSEVPLYEPTYLHWALQEPTPFDPVTVYPRVPRYLGICRTDETQNGFRIGMKHRSFVTPEVLNDSGEYKIHIEIVAARAPTLSRQLLITWNGKWHQISARLAEDT